MIALLSSEGGEGEDEQEQEEEAHTHIQKTGRLERLGASITRFFKVKEASLVRHRSTIFLVNIMLTIIVQFRFQLPALEMLLKFKSC